MQFHRYNPVYPGDTLGVFAGSGPFAQPRLQKGLDRLKEAGFKIKCARGIDARQGFLAGSDEHRFGGLKDLIEDDEVKGLIAARGGYGMPRLLPKLQTLNLDQLSKPIIGFSDVTALHAWLHNQGVSSIHGPVVTQLGELPQSTAAQIVKVLSEPQGYMISSPDPSLKPGVAEGRLIGGNLAVLCSLLGTPYLSIPKGAILLLEDVGEATFRLDRMLTQLINAGVFNRVSGIVLGAFTDCKCAQPHHQSFMEVLTDRLSPFDIPIGYGFPVGHGEENIPIPLGLQVRLDANEGTLQVL